MLISSERASKTAAYRWRIGVDVDPLYAQLQHVGNIELGRLFHEARVAFNRAAIDSMQGPQHFSDQVIVRIATDFFSEILWSPELEVCVRLGQVGRTSYELELVIFDGERVASRCVTTSVWMKNGSSEALTNEAREVLATLA